MSADTKSVEDSIKIALDAADVATNVTDEFARITSDYSAVEGKVKKMYRNATIIFVSSAAASLIAVLVASMMYYRTMETMETSNNTSLEALVIFAENVDKLAAATTALDVSLAEQEQLLEATAAANEALARIENQQELNAAQTRDGLVDLSETNIASVSQFSSGVLNKIDVDLVTQTETITAALAQIELAQSQLMETVMAEGSTEQAGQAMGPEMAAKVEAILMLQREISAKITAANSPPPRTRTAPKPKTKATKPQPKTDEPITYP